MPFASSSPTIEVVHQLSSRMESNWDAFVMRQAAASFFHLLGWKRAVEDTFGYRSCYLYTERAGNITGILPLFSVSNWIIGHCLLSIPFAVYGGMVTEDREVEQNLLKHIKGIASSQRADYIELRTRKSTILPEFHLDTKYSSFGTELSSDPDVNFKRLPRDTRYMIRKGQKAGLAAKWGLEQLGVFYGLFARNMRHHGTPVFPRKLFDNLVREFSQAINLMIVYAGEKPVAGVFSFIFRDTILPYYAGVTREARVVAANNFMYWELMRWAAEHGISWFDFGRSKKNTGAYAFKTQWNMEAQDLDYQIFLGRRRTVPNFSPLNSKFAIGARLWSNLPLWTTTLLGPLVSPWFP